MWFKLATGLEVLTTKLYPMALRMRAVRFVEAGHSRHAVAERLGVSVSCVIRWLQRFPQTRSVAPGKVGGHPRAKISGEHCDWVLRQVKSSDVTLYELAERGWKVDAVTVWNFLRRESNSFKKTVHGTEQLRPDVARRRYWWNKYQNRINASPPVFIDETWTKTNF